MTAPPGARPAAPTPGVGDPEPIAPASDGGLPDDPADGSSVRQLALVVLRSEEKGGARDPPGSLDGPLSVSGHPGATGPVPRAPRGPPASASVSESICPCLARRDKGDAVAAQDVQRMKRVIGPTSRGIKAHGRRASLGAPTPQVSMGVCSGGEERRADRRARLRAASGRGGAQGQPARECAKSGSQGLEPGLSDPRGAGRLGMADESRSKSG